MLFRSRADWNIIFVGMLKQAIKQVFGSNRSGVLQSGIERLDPFVGFGWVGIYEIFDVLLRRLEGFAHGHIFPRAGRKCELKGFFLKFLDF